MAKRSEEPESMWIRKSEAEKEDDKRAAIARKRRLGEPAIMALLITLLLTGSHAIGCRGKFEMPAEPMSFDEVMGYLPISTAVIFPFIFAITVFVQRRGLLDDASSMLCTSCKCAQHPRKAGCVHCGGVLEPLKDWRWQEENELPSEVMPRESSSWICPKCSDENPLTFDICWKCGTPSPQVTTASKSEEEST